MTEVRKCQNEHEMRLIDVHLQTINGLTAYKPRHNSLTNLQLVKEFECPLCGQKDTVREEAT